MDNQTLQTIKNRRSHRSFAEGLITNEEINTIIEAGLYAPSAHNDQSWHFTVIQDAPLLNQLNQDVKEAIGQMESDHFKNLAINDKFNIFYHAPAIILISGNKKCMMPETDCAAATQNMLLAAESLGLGSCWIGFVRYAFKGAKRNEYLEKLHIPEDYEPYYAIAIGKKKADITNAPERKAGTVTYIL